MRRFINQLIAGELSRITRYCSTVVQVEPVGFDDGLSVSEAPLGMSDGQGDEAGVSQLLWLETFIKANWSLSQYQVSRTDLEATAWVIYNKEGTLIDFSLPDRSGERIFDESIKNAILKSGQLDFEPGFANQKVTITFNLKDLLDR